MSFIVSFVIYLTAIIAAPLYLTNNVSFLVNVPSAIAVFPAAYVFAAGILSLQSANLALTSVFKLETLDTIQLKQCQAFYRLIGNLCLLLGILGIFIGWSAMAHFEWEVGKQLGAAMAISILTLLYAIIGKIPLYAAEKRCELLLQQKPAN